jgi:hypothetical protein
MWRQMQLGHTHYRAGSEDLAWMGEGLGDQGKTQVLVTSAGLGEGHWSPLLGSNPRIRELENPQMCWGFKS